MNIYALNTLDFGLETCRLLMDNIPLKGIIGLSERDADDSISGYIDCSCFCIEHNLEFIPVKDYTLKNDNDREKIQLVPVDILLVTGWQRLIPDWLIRHCRISAIGIHGSPGGITSGRGRSPQVWALISGKTEFSLSIFKITSGIDSGDIYDTGKFSLSNEDDIKSSCQKSSHLAAAMIIKNIRNNRITDNVTIHQSGEAFYYPRRIPSDGEIDWNRDATEIYNFIRAQTKPYPGAFTFLNKTKLTIWKARPLYNIVTKKKRCPGELLEITSMDELIIAAGNGYILAVDYNLPETNQLPLVVGSVFSSCNFCKQMDFIIKRHQEKYPDLPLAGEILALAGDRQNKMRKGIV